jgi:hypothetical protein
MVEKKKKRNEVYGDFGTVFKKQTFGLWGFKDRESQRG